MLPIGVRPIGIVEKIYNIRVGNGGKAESIISSLRKPLVYMYCVDVNI